MKIRKHGRSIKNSALIMLLLFVPHTALGALINRNPKASHEINRIFSKITASSSGVKTLSSDFVQEKHLSILDNMVTSKGRFYYKRDKRLRWELTEPEVLGFTVNGKRAKRWKNNIKLRQTFEIHKAPAIKAFTDQLFTWVNPDIKQIQKRYRIQVIGDNPIDLKLFPNSTQEKKHIDHLRLTFAADAIYVSAVEVHEPDGDYTRIRFMNMKINEPLQDSLFN